MDIIDNIQDRILRMEAGAFQRLCDAYLSKKGYSGGERYHSLCR